MSQLRDAEQTLDPGSEDRHTTADPEQVAHEQARNNLEETATRRRAGEGAVKHVPQDVNSKGQQKIELGGTLKVFLEFVGGQPHHTEYEFSDQLELHTRIRGRTSCRVGSPAHIKTCSLSEDAHNAANAKALTKLGGTFRGQSPRYQPLRKYAKYQPRPVCRYRIGTFLSRPSSGMTGEAGYDAKHPYCFAATVHTRPGLSYWRYTYAAKATGPEADEARLAACALAISDWLAQAAKQPSKPARGHLAYSFALRSHNRGPQFKLLRAQEVRRSAADSAGRSLPEENGSVKLAKLPKNAVIEAIDISEEIDSRTRRRVRHILVGVGDMEPKHVHTLLMQCGLSAHAEVFFGAAIDGAMLLKLKSSELDKWCAMAQVSCDVQTRRTILRAVEEIESGTGKISGWLTAPAASRAVWHDDDSDSSHDGYDDDMDLLTSAEALESPDNGLIAVLSSPRVSASGQASVYAPPYSVVGENTLRLEGVVSSNLSSSRQRINKTVLGRRKTLEQGYSHTEVTLRTAFPLAILESYAISQHKEWRCQAFKWGADKAEDHINAVAHAIAESRAKAARQSFGVDTRSEHTEEVIALLLRAERGNPRCSPAIAELERVLKSESIDKLKKRLAMSDMITDDAIASAEAAVRCHRPGRAASPPNSTTRTAQALRQLLLDAADNKGASERLLEKLVVHTEKKQAISNPTPRAETVLQQELDDAVELGSPPSLVPEHLHLKFPEPEHRGKMTEDLLDYAKMTEDLLGATLVSRDGELSTSDAMAGKTHIGIYFSAHWCPTCRSFTTQLVDWYNANATSLSMEIVFASSDNDDAAFKAYFIEMPWKALPYSARDLTGTLTQKYDVRGIPTLVIVDANTGELCTTNGREGVSKGAAGLACFPWSSYPQPGKSIDRADLVSDAKAHGQRKQMGTNKKNKQQKKIVRAIKPQRPTATVPFKLGVDVAEGSDRDLESSYVEIGTEEAVMQLKGRSLAPSRQMKRQNRGHAGRWSWEWRQSNEGKRALAARRKALNDRYSKERLSPGSAAPHDAGDMSGKSGSTSANALRGIASLSVEQARARGTKVETLKLGDAILEQANLGASAAEKLWQAGLTTGAKVASRTNAELKALGISPRARTAIRKACDIIDNTHSIIVEVGASESNRKVVLVRGLLSADSTPVGLTTDPKAKFAVHVQRVGAEPTVVPSTECDPPSASESQAEPASEAELAPEAELASEAEPASEPEPASDAERKWNVAQRSADEGGTLFRPLIQTVSCNGGGVDPTVRGVHQLEVIRLDAQNSEAGAGGPGENGWSFNLRLRCTIARCSTSSSKSSNRYLTSSAPGHLHWDYVHASTTNPTPAKYREIAQQAGQQAKSASMDARVAQAEGQGGDAAVALWFQQQAEGKANAALLSAAIRKGQQVDEAALPRPSMQSSLSASIPAPSYWQWKQTPEGKRTIRQHTKHVDALYSRDRRGVPKSADEIEADLRLSYDYDRGPDQDGQEGPSVVGDEQAEAQARAAKMMAELDGRVRARKSIRVQL